MSVTKDGVLFYAEPLKHTTGVDAYYGFELQAAYLYDKNKGLVKTEATKQQLAELNPSYIKVGDTFTFENVRYKLLKFGLKKIQADKQTDFVIPGIQKTTLKDLYCKGSGMRKSKGKNHCNAPEYDVEIYNDPNQIRSEISRALVLGDKLIVGFAGGFPEGVEVPGGVAVFDFSTLTWHVEWNKELINLYITDIVPISSSAVWFSTRHNMEYQSNSGGVFEYDLKVLTVKKINYSHKMWALKKSDDYVFMTGPEGVRIYDLTKQREDVYLWSVDVDERDRVKTELVKCQQQHCLFPSYEKIYNLYIAELFEVKNKSKFVTWVAETQFEEFLPGKKGLRSWVNLPYCSDGLSIPKDFLQYIDLKYLIQKSRIRTTPMFWKTLSSIVKASKQELQYKQLIIDATNDQNASVSRLAKECLQDLFPKEYPAPVNPLQLY